MAKTLVGLYDSLTEAEQVVQNLAAEKFTPQDVMIATHDTTGRHKTDAYAGKATRMGDGQALTQKLTGLGVPQSDADTYAEGVRRGGALVVVKASDTRADRGMDILQGANLVDIDARAATWRQEGWGHQAQTTPSAAAAAPQGRERDRQRHTEGERTIPLVEEEIAVGKREVERGRVRIHSHVEEHPVEESVRLREERARVERHPVDRPATEADLAAARDETIEVTETAEEPVVRKRARVVEEVTVDKDVEEHAETVRDTVRRTEVDVESAEGQSARAGRGFEAYAPEFRQHYTSTTRGGGAYEDYEPAYRYGYDLGANPRYRGREWREVETDARREWEGRRIGPWERFRDAIRYGWDNIDPVPKAVRAAH